MFDQKPGDREAYREAYASQQIRGIQVGGMILKQQHFDLFDFNNQEVGFPKPLKKHTFRRVLTVDLPVFLLP